MWCFEAVFCFSRVDIPPTGSYLKSFVKIRDVVKIAILQNWERWPKCSLIHSPYRMMHGTECYFFAVGSPPDGGNMYRGLFKGLFIQCKVNHVETRVLYKDPKLGFKGKWAP